MGRNATIRLLNVTCDTPSRGVAHRLRTRSMRQSPTQRRRRGNGVVRARALARHQHPAYEAATPLAILGGLLLWLLRLALAPASTLAGFRAWVLAECPVAPGRRAPAAGPAPAPPPRKATKTARFLALAAERHGSLASIPLDAVASISADLAPQAGLHPGTARAALRKAVLAAKNGDPR
jgi:hypothetical protein